MKHINCGDANAVVSIPLTDGTYALVNKRDACLVRMYRWGRTKAGYAQTVLPNGLGPKGQKRFVNISMHRLILGVHDVPVDQRMDTAVDHWDNVKWNNVRKNIEVVGQTINAQRAYLVRKAKYQHKIRGT